MSRKTTSGPRLSSAVRTSFPLRHSPTTTKSVNAASNCRTPRRAAGSSSAMSTRHLRDATVSLVEDHLAVRHDEPGARAPLESHDVQIRAIAVQRAQPLARVLDSVTVEI